MIDAATIIARNYLAQARVLGRSFAQHHPGRLLNVLLIDGDVAPRGVEDEPFRLISPSELAIDREEFGYMATIYSPLELATALKPWLLRHMLERGSNTALYLDPDIEVFCSLDDLERYASRDGIVLTPHMLAPIPADGCRPTHGEIAQAGVFNLGCIAVSRRATPFLTWWAARLRRDCIVDPSRGLFVDQRLLDFVPGFYEHAVVRNRSYNVAYWNLHERDVAWVGQRYEVDGEPLRFFHYSGFDPCCPDVLSKHQGRLPRIKLADRPVLARMCGDYAEKLLAEGYEQAAATSYGYGQTATGLALDHQCRRTYRQDLVAHEEASHAALPNPFDPAEAEAFSAWWDSRDLKRRLPPLDRARLALRTGPDLSSPRWWVPHARRLVLRVLRHSNHHQRQVQAALVEATEALQARTDEIERELRETKS